MQTTIMQQFNFPIVNFPIVLRRESVDYNPRTNAFERTTETVRCQEVTDANKAYLLTSDGRVPILVARSGGAWSTQEKEIDKMWEMLCSPDIICNLFWKSTFPNNTLDQFADLQWHPLRHLLKHPLRLTVEFVKVGTPFKIFYDGDYGEILGNDDDELPNVPFLQI